MRTKIAFFACALAACCSISHADETAQEKSPLSYTVRTLVFGSAQDPGHSTQNPDNAFLRLYRYSGELDVRPDFFLETRMVNVSFKPRLSSSYRWWEDGVTRGETDGLSRAFVNEWEAQVKPHDTLLLSFGKQKLLWGSSFLANPSNLLFKATEKVNPKVEVEGKYLARLVYLPNNAVTVSVINETQKEDAGNSGNDHSIRALKAEIMGGNYLLALIGYQRRDDRFRLGSYGQWTASDAVVLYYDGVISRGTDTLYAETDLSQPLGGSFVRKRKDSDSFFTTVAAGGTYAFLSGDAVSLEFLYNREGYGDAEAREYYRLRGNAADNLTSGGALSALSSLILSQSSDTGSSFLRRYYLMGQYQFREIRKVLDIILRYEHGLEERAGRVSTIIEWRVTDRIQLFNLNTWSVDNDRQTEFNSLLKNSFMLGLEMHF